MIHISLFLYGLSLGLAQAFRLDTYRPLVIPLAWLTGFGAILFAVNYAELNEFFFESYVPLNILMGAIIPVGLIVALIVFRRNKKHKRE